MVQATQWEYRLETIGGSAWRAPKDQELEALLDAWGEEGWEVINLFTAPGTNRITVVAKRPLTLSTRRRRSMPVY